MKHHLTDLENKTYNFGISFIVIKHMEYVVNKSKHNMTNHLASLNGYISFDMIDHE